jgi:hypothetical protein
MSERPIGNAVPDAIPGITVDKTFQTNVIAAGAPAKVIVACEVDVTDLSFWFAGSGTLKRLAMIF